MLALGLAVEAGSLLQVAIAQDPKAAAAPDLRGLAAIAALVANRPQDADAVDDPGLTGTDDIAFWRAVRKAMIDEDSAAAAQGFATTAGLALTLPTAMRNHVLPLAVETMIRGGEPDRAARLLEAARDDSQISFARALLAEIRGETDDALKRYDALAMGHDQFDHARAAWSAAELRLRTGTMSPTDAAKALDKLLYAWRGDRHDLSHRQRVATLRRQIGDWRGALALLRGTESDFPSQAPAVHRQLLDAFAALVDDPAAAHLPPLELITLVDENPDLATEAGDAEAFQDTLADRLAALDLPGRTDSLLEKLTRAAGSGPRRATLGARLAAVRLHENDAAGALTALSLSDGANLPAPLAESRLLLAAQATARNGNVADALGMIAALDTVRSRETEATIQEQAGDWNGAERALSRYVELTVPNEGPLSEQQRGAILRLAIAQAHAGDQTGLAALRERDEPRLGDGPETDLFRLLTAPPVGGVEDLGRVKREIGLVRAVPASLKAMSSH